MPATLPVPTLRVHKGLPFDIDVGVSYAAVPSSNVRVIGGELRWAMLAGSTVTPAVALRASVSSLSGVDQLKLRTTGLDVSVSKGFALLTPYAGIGTVRVKSETEASGGKSPRELQSEQGVRWPEPELRLDNLAFEGDKTGDATSYGVKFGLRF